MAAYKGFFKGKVKGEDQIFWNPAGSHMAKSSTNGKENINLSYFLNGNTNDLITEEHPLYDALKAVIQLGGVWKQSSMSEPDEPPMFMELMITRAELREIEKRVMKEKKKEGV